jgi:hypothetical protein
MIGVWRLARLLVRYRARSAVNAVRARPAGPFSLLLLFGLGSAVAYVGLFATALATIGARAGRVGEGTALGLMTGAIALASLTAKSSGEGLFAGTPENEFLLARPISLARLVAARGLAALVTDPFGTLFLLPVLLAAALAWQLSPGATPVALATSLLAQLTIAALAQAIQIAVVRWVPRRRRTMLFVGLRLLAAVTLALVWIAATAVLRAPALFAQHGLVLQRWALLAGSLATPLIAYRAGGAAASLRALLPLAGGAVIACAAALAIARRAGLHGWEEAGAPWSDSGTLAPAGPPLTLVRREWRLLARDRPRLAALVVLPALLLAVQWLGAVGWSSISATLDRAAMVTFSIAVYLAALGPLPHMQQERRAFWILRSVPASIERVMRAKVLAWAPLVGGAALARFGALAWSLRAAGRAPAAQIAVTGALVVVGAVVITALAVGLGCLAADLSDEQRGALGPGTVYLFLLLGGLLNVVFGAGRWDGVRIALLYLMAVAAVWRSGMVQAGNCLDPEAHRLAPVCVADAAILLLLFALVPVALQRGMGRADITPGAIATALVAALILFGLASARMLRRRSVARLGVRGPAAAVVAGLLCGAATSGVRQLVLGAGSPMVEPLRQPPLLLVLSLAVALSEELVLRGVVQGAAERELHPTGRAAPWLAAAVAFGAAQLAAPELGALSLLVGAAPTIARAATGRLLAACVARAVILLAGS